MSSEVMAEWELSHFLGVTYRTDGRWEPLVDTQTELRAACYMLFSNPIAWMQFSALTPDNVEVVKTAALRVLNGRKEPKGVELQPKWLHVPSNPML